MLRSDLAQPLPMGQIIITPGALRTLASQDITDALRRHAGADHDDFNHPEQGEKKRAALQGCRRLSAYRAQDGTRFWVISEADEPLTTVLLPEDY